MRSGSGPGRVPAPPGDLRRIWAGFEALRRTTQGSHRSPAKRVRWEEEEQWNERVFALLGENEGYGTCDDEKQDKGLGSLPRISPGTSARSAGSFKGPRSQQKWGQKRQRNKILQSLSRSAYARKKKPGVNPKKGGLYEPKREIRPLPDA